MISHVGNRCQALILPPLHLDDFVLSLMISALIVNIVVSSWGWIRSFTLAHFQFA